MPPHILPLEINSVSHSRKIAVIGLGYVGLPVAASFAAAGSQVIGFDIDARRIEELKTGYDRTLEVEKDKLLNANLGFTADRATLKTGDFFIVTVPTPLIERLTFTPALPDKGASPDARFNSYVPRLLADMTGDLEGDAKAAPAKKGKKKAQ